MNKCNSLLSTRSKGLTLSLKKNIQDKNSTSFNTIARNGESLDNSSIIRLKNYSTLTKTTHTIHNLGKSSGKSNEVKNKTV